MEAIAIKDGKIDAAGTNDEILRQRGPATKVIDVGGRAVIPGLNDSHMHPIRGGLNYNLELRWDGVPGAAGYKVMRATVSGGPYSVVQTTDRASFVDTKSLAELSDISTEALIALAAFVGKTRLIDNTIVKA